MSFKNGRRLRKNEIENDLKQFTVLKLQEMTPKFKILNLLLSGEDLSKYDFILIVDDDIALPDDFVDNYLTAVQKYDFARRLSRQELMIAISIIYLWNRWTALLPEKPGLWK